MSERPRKLVVAALIKQGCQILMSQRRADQSLPLHWEFPGGKIEAGESPEVALRREVKEELGCDLAVGDIADVVFHAYEDFDLYMLIYNCTLPGEEPRAVEVAAVRWVDTGALLALKLPPADIPLAKRLASQPR